MITIYCKNTGTSREFPEGTTLLDMIPSFDFPRPHPIVAARVNNIAEGLKFRAFNNRDVEFLDYSSYVGRSVYCRSLCFLFTKAMRDIFPERKVSLKRPISKGYFCETELDEAELTKVKGRMSELVDMDLPFHRYEARMDDAIDLFKAIGYEDKVKLLETSEQLYISYYTLDGTPDYYYDSLVPSTAYLKVWALEPYNNGVILRVPDRHKPSDLAPFTEQPKTFKVFAETMKWNRIMQLQNVGDVNKACLNGKAADLIQVAEALQERKIVQIAEEIDRRFRENGLKVVLITGPSSSGKSTFCKRLSIQLKACGLQPVSFSTDDYFVNRVETPLLPDGSYDFDNFETVSHDLLQEDVIKLLAGEEVQLPHYNFVTGLREMSGYYTSLSEGQILLIEGIHALNPGLIPDVSEKKKFKIFISTLTSISLDDHNCIPTSDNRLLRRIIRDYSCGAFSARETIANWPNVRRSEVKWIYPYQEDADVLFNSAYLVEFAVLRNHAERILSTVPKNCPEYSEAFRLLKFLSYFTPVPDKEIPSNSLIRGFIGGSSL